MAMRRDIWYTQAYTMSTISLDPGRDYIELVDQSRVMGVQFATKTSDRLVVYAGNRPAEKKREYKMPTSNGVIGMLGPDCMIVARDPSANAKKSNSTRIFISDGPLWDNREENDGWFFTRAGNGYAAFRIVGKQGYDVVTSPYENGTFIEFKDIWAPIVIQMGQAKEYKNDFARFKATVKGTAVTYEEGKLSYTALSGDTYEYWSRSKTLPRRNGQTIDLNPEMVYDFPCLKMKYGEDQATIRYPGYPDLLVPANRQNKEAKRETGDTMKKIKHPKERKAFEEALNGDWETVLSDSCTEDWKEKWFLDGEVGTVTTGSDGMALTAGPEFRNDAHHMVLWTKDVFEGDVKIEYDYTRLDEAINCVNILYIQATGSGEEPYVRDISKWNELRTIPAMKTYFNHMHTYHISYAANPNEGNDNRAYIRARRYMPNATGLKGSDLKPDYFPKGLFKTGVPHKITVIKKDRDIFMRVQNPEQAYYCHMTNPDLPPITAGRIGLRHMFTRSARYKNFKISNASK